VTAGHDDLVELLADAEVRILEHVAPVGLSR
jgi:hypothetical protein